MKTLEELRKDQDEVVEQALAIKGEDLPPEERAEKLRGFDTQWEELEKQIKAEGEFGEGEEKFKARQKAVDDERERTRPKIYGDLPDDRGPGSENDDPITPGELFTRSEAYDGWMKRFPNGGPSGGVEAASEAVDAGDMLTRMLGLSSATDKLRSGLLLPSMFRALVTSDNASAGRLVPTLDRGLLEPGLVRPLTVRQLVTVIPVQTDAIEYVKEASRVSAAAAVAEASALTGTTGTKPEGGLTFTQVQDTITTLAEWVPATKRILADGRGLRAYIDQYLVDDLGIELEDQIVAGGGTPPDMRGILNVSGIQTAGPPAAASDKNELDVLLAARNKIILNARTRPTAALINPADLERVLTRKWGTAGSASGYQAGGPFATEPSRVWGMPLVESEAVPAGTALVGDFRRAILFDRESINISVGTANDDFIRNIVRVLAEMRVGFGVLRPAAFVAADIQE